MPRIADTTTGSSEGVRLIVLESGKGGGKTHIVDTLKESLREAIDENLKEAGAPSPAEHGGYHRLHAAFHDDGESRSLECHISSPVRTVLHAFKASFEPLMTI